MSKWKTLHVPGKPPKPCHKLPVIAFQPLGKVIACTKCGERYRLDQVGAYPHAMHIEWVEEP